MLKKLLKIKHWGLLVVLLLAFLTVRPLFATGFFSVHDDTQVVRVEQMAKALADGQFPVRWVADLGYGYGYPLFNFYGPLPYYFGAFLNVIGFDALVATKMMFFTGTILAGIFMYFLAREFWGEWGGVLAGVAYQYAPYHAVDVYIRGAVGEFWALAFLPLFVYGLYKFLTRSGKKAFFTAGLALAAIILSHNITAMLTVFLGFLTAGILTLVCFRQTVFVVGLKRLLAVAIFALGLSAFFWLPAIWEMKLTMVKNIIGETGFYSQHWLFLDQLWNSPWGFAGSAPGRLDGMSFRIGKIHLLGALITLLFLVVSRSRFKLSEKTTILLVFFIGTFSVLMTLAISAPLWQIFPFLALAQYPWRFIVFIVFAASFLFGGLTVAARILRLKYLLQTILFVPVCFLIVAFNLKYFQPQDIFPVKAGDYLTPENIKWRVSKVSDEYLPRNFIKPLTEKEVAWEKLMVFPEVTLLKSRFQSTSIFVELSADFPHEVLVKTAYFPGWHVYLDGYRHDYLQPDGQILVEMPAGRHRLVLKFENTPVRRLGNFISLFAAGSGFFLLFVYERIKKKS